MAGMMKVPLRILLLLEGRAGGNAAVVEDMELELELSLLPLELLMAGSVGRVCCGTEQAFSWARERPRAVSPGQPRDSAAGGDAAGVCVVVDGWLGQGWAAIVEEAQVLTKLVASCRGDGSEH